MKYIKPIVLMNEDLSEGIYAASGTTADSVCYDISQHDWQDWGEHYWVAVNFQHNPLWENGHKSGKQTITFYFNESAFLVDETVYGNGNIARGDAILSGNGTSVITVEIGSEVDIYGAVGMVALKVKKSTNTIGFTKATITCHS